MSDSQLDSAAQTVSKAIVKFVANHTELFKPVWVERREISKILVSLSSASLVFSITFSASIVKPWTPPAWRYVILACWVLLVGSLASAIGSLWFSMELPGLPALVTMSEENIRDQIKQAMGKPDWGDLQAGLFIGEHTRKLGRQDRAAQWLLRTSLGLFGLALIMLTILGVLQLFY
jgi:hypothetical protein